MPATSAYSASASAASSANRPRSAMPTVSGHAAARPPVGLTERRRVRDHREEAGSAGVYFVGHFARSVVASNVPSRPSVPSTTTWRPSLKMSGTTPAYATGSVCTPSVTAKRRCRWDASQRTDPGATVPPSRTRAGSAPARCSSSPTVTQYVAPCGVPPGAWTAPERSRSSETCRSSAWLRRSSEYRYANNPSQTSANAQNRYVIALRGRVLQRLHPDLEQPEPDPGPHQRDVHEAPGDEAGQ